MSLDSASLLAIAVMALVTYATRIAGYLAVRTAQAGPRLEGFLQASPKTMFVALVTLPLLQGSMVEWVGAATAVASMVLSRNLLVSIVAASLVVALLRGV